MSTESATTATTPTSSLFFGGRPAFISLRSSKMSVSPRTTRRQARPYRRDRRSCSARCSSPPRITGSVGGGRPPRHARNCGLLSSRSIEPLSSSIIGFFEGEPFAPAAFFASASATSSGGGGRPMVVGQARVDVRIPSRRAVARGSSERARRRRRRRTDRRELAGARRARRDRVRLHGERHVVRRRRRLVRVLAGHRRRREGAARLGLELVLMREHRERRRRNVRHDAVRRGERARRELGHLVCRLPDRPPRAPHRRVGRNEPASERGAQLVESHAPLLSVRVGPSPEIVAHRAQGDDSAPLGRPVQSLVAWDFVDFSSRFLDASTSVRTPRAPAARRASAHALRVAPVVRTSSTSRTRRPASASGDEQRNASATLAERAARSSDACGGVGRVRRRPRAACAIPSRRAIGAASSAA